MVAIVATLFLLVYAAAMAPRWINDHRLASLADRAREHPLPPSTTFLSWEPQGPVTGDSGDCWADFAFRLRTDRPAEEIKRYYEAAPFMRTDAHFSELSVIAWQVSSDQVSVAVSTISSGIGDPRCW
ncbi:hypothetical protein SAMN05421811_117209 [Nonomuraea wenchangensis]|uniref:Uncharacterized protein n=1 Tax=Nonomuraea wenchangensis TaxID=568860 RepID=A0A1I0LK70_9ACTN|nr:hypothetical protein SAMN05421811_117209 [Nonomuraea wenchangensis]